MFLEKWWVIDTLNAFGGGRLGAVAVVSWLFWIVISITLHELGHGWIAIREGDQTPRLMNRMTTAPFVHMPPISWLMLVIFGLTWGYMPVDESRMRHTRWSPLKVAAAGPAVNLIIALIVTLIWIVMGVFPPGITYMAEISVFLTTGMTLNVVLFLLNLVPLPPLDGSRILASLHPGYRSLVSHPNADGIGMFLFVILIFVGPGALLFWHASEYWLLGAVKIVELIAGV